MLYPAEVGTEQIVEATAEQAAELVSPAMRLDTYLQLKDCQDQALPFLLHQPPLSRLFALLPSQPLNPLREVRSCLLEPPPDQSLG